MNRIVIMYESRAEQTAKKLAAKLRCRKIINIDEINEYSKDIEAVNAGFVLFQDGHGLSETALDNMRAALHICKPDCLEYLFSVCVGKNKPHYSLKIAERLCIKNGFGVSYSAFVKSGNEEDTIAQIAQDVENGEIKLPNRCFAPNLYAKFKGIK